ncbi:hypothetical protein SAMN05660297_02754 [Natronincola peptidivorans]|uniref:Uncharacterized protein n=1 Tax=Natronincola peptidivorans TaxID=426128 RepID=A0A1I0FCE6_9FIRM|nr:hypothetical protein SAMN05660297_02754 [Natronincola peptidivorans]
MKELNRGIKELVKLEKGKKMICECLEWGNEKIRYSAALDGSL